jgi:hypothetical protein
MKTLFGKENWKNISKGMPNSLYALSLSLHWWLTHPQTNPVTWLPSQISPKNYPTHHHPGSMAVIPAATPLLASLVMAMEG